MSETSPTYRTGDSGDEQPEDWGGTLLPVPGLTDAELEVWEALCTAPRTGGWHDLLENPLELRYERTIRLLQDAVGALLAEVRRLQWELAATWTERDEARAAAATWQALAETEERLLTQAPHFLEQYLDARWAGVPYTPEGKRR